LSHKVLVTGGAGYIGSHTLIELISAGYTPVVLDNFCNSSPKALKAVQQIVGSPIEYVDGDIRDAQKLLAMQRANVHRLIFSSSAAVYGCPETVPIDETFPLQPMNPYGRSKLMVEDICRDIASCYANTWRANEMLNWRANKSLEEMMTDTWRWHKNKKEGLSPLL